jgi:peroxiredoxin
MHLGGIMRLSLVCALGALALATGCNPDPDGDGLTTAEEKDLGTNPKAADSDGDGLEDAMEVDVGTNPLSVDTDGDGLSDKWETDNGFDATDADPDHDGFSDGDERSGGSDPSNKFSWPFSEGVWPDFSGDANFTPSGWDKGMTVDDVEFTDQYGNTVDLYAFAGYVILMDFSAGWCGPCRAVAAQAQGEWVERREDGFLIIHNMIADNSNNFPSVGFLASWADQYQIEFPVVSDKSQVAWGGAAASSMYQGGIPFMIVIDQEMKVDSGYTGGGSGVASALARVDALLAQ